MSGTRTRTRTRIQVENYNMWQHPPLSGFGDNLFDPYKGANHTPLARAAAPDYSANNGLAVRGASNPNPRAVSNAICATNEPSANALGLSNFVWGWGQFVDHELDLTPDNSGISANMTTPPHDQFPNYTIPFTRSGGSNDGDGVRQQPNVISAFIDGTNVYGTDQTRMRALRALDGTGKMKTSTATNGETILPLNTAGIEMLNPTHLPEGLLFMAGDVRANENIVLIAFHTLFVREHNRLCDELLAENPAWLGQDEVLFQEARKYVIAYTQNITVSEFIPHLVGTDAAPQFEVYQPGMDPSIRNEFSSAGYRIGHTMVTDILNIFGGAPVSLLAAFFNPGYVVANGVDDILVGAANQTMKEIDGTLVNDLRNNLFGPPQAQMLLDLAALNMQRGRDHGIPGYNAVREAYGLPRIEAFADVPTTAANRTALEGLYDSVDDIDPWVMVVAETHAEGAAVGPLAQAILRDQFGLLINGSRFYFEHYLPRDKVAAIKGVTLADIVRRNIDPALRTNISDDIFTS